MGQFNLDDYEPVEVRLKKYLSEHKDARVLTEMVSPVEAVAEQALFKASIYEADVLLATGWAFERKDDGYINKGAHVENCETSAIGRALANLGFHGNKRPSREEMDKAQRAQSKEDDTTSGGSGRAPMKTCPKCGKQAVIKGKAEYGGGWVCWKKQGGCGANFDENEPAFHESGGDPEKAKALAARCMKGLTKLKSLTEMDRDTEDTYIDVIGSAEHEGDVAELEKLMRQLADKIRAAEAQSAPESDDSKQLEVF